jgi:hypothetical protein
MLTHTFTAWLQELFCSFHPPDLFICVVLLDCSLCICSLRSSACFFRCLVCDGVEKMTGNWQASLADGSHHFTSQWYYVSHRQLSSRRLIINPVIQRTNLSVLPTNAFSGCLWLLKLIAISLKEILRYEPEGRGLDSRWGHWGFGITLSIQLHYGPGVYSDCNWNK